MAANGGNSATISQHLKMKKPISFYTDTPPSSQPQTQIPTLVQSTLCKSSISSLFISPKSKNFSASKFRGMGCAAISQQVTVPAAVETEEVRKMKLRKNKKMKKIGDEPEPERDMGNVLMENQNPPLLSSMLNSSSSSSSSSSASFSDVIWCVNDGDGDDSGSVDYGGGTRNVVVSSRGKIDGDKVNPRERTFTTRRASNPEQISFPDFDSAFGSIHSESDVFGGRYSGYVQRRSPEALGEILMFQRGGLLMGGRLASRDKFRDWRLNTDDMTYEDLLALGEKIGYVSTGLNENEMSRYLRKCKGSFHDKISQRKESKCSICQEECEEDEELGKLKCGHVYHMQCIKQWLVQKNACPVCKSQVVPRR